MPLLSFYFNLNYYITFFWSPSRRSIFVLAFRRRSVYNEETNHAAVAEWQTRYFEGVVIARSCEFKSHRPHQKLREMFFTFARSSFFYFEICGVIFFLHLSVQDVAKQHLLSILNSQISIFSRKSRKQCAATKAKNRLTSDRLMSDVSISMSRQNLIANS